MDRINLYKNLDGVYSLNLDVHLRLHQNDDEIDFLKDTIKQFENLLYYTETEIKRTIDSSFEKNHKRVFMNKFDIEDLDTYLIEKNNEKLYFEKIIEFYKMKMDLLIGNNPLKLDQKIKNPFKDKKTNDLFNYIVDKWDYHKGQKWADIYTIINDLYEYKTPEKKEYQKYIIQRYGYTGKFQYNIISKKNENVLSELIDEFSKL